MVKNKQIHVPRKTVSVIFTNKKLTLIKKIKNLFVILEKYEKSISSQRSWMSIVVKIFVPL